MKKSLFVVYFNLILSLVFNNPVISLADEIDLNDPFYKLGWKNLENPENTRIQIPLANASIEIVDTEIYLDEKDDIRIYDEYVSGNQKNLEDINETLIISDKEQFYTIETRYYDTGYIKTNRFKNFTPKNILETINKRKPDSAHKITWLLEPNLTENKISTYGYKVDYKSEYVLYFYYGNILGKEGVVEVKIGLIGDGSESEDYFKYYEGIIKEVSDTVRFDDNYKYTDFNQDDYLSPYTLTNVIDGSWGEGITTDQTVINAYCLITTGALKKAGIIEEDYPRFAGKVLTFYISNIKNEIMDVSPEDGISVLSGMYGIEDKQNFQKLNISLNNPRTYDINYTNIIEVEGDKPEQKVKYEYKNKLVINNGIPKLLFAKIDQTGFSFNKWNLTLGCQDKVYKEEEILAAKYDKSNPLLNSLDQKALEKILNKVIIEGDKITKQRGNQKEVPFNYSLLIEQDGTDYMIVNRYPGIQSGKLLKFTYVYNSKSEYAQFFEQVYKNGPNPNLITSIQPNKFNIDGELEDYFSSEYILDDFNFSYSTRMGDYMLNFETETGGERVLSYIANKESFSLASYLENEAWHASTFKVLSNIEDFKNLAKNYPTTLCNILWEPLIKKLNIKELNNSNLEEVLNKNGINKSSLGCK